VARDRREGLARAEARVSELEARITALRNDLSPVDLGNPNREQTRQAAIDQAQRELEAAQAALVAARKAVEDLEDDARRAGALPGWVR
jgi:DNA repair exonuclease SbcCD ATPase subunit